VTILCDGGHRYLSTIHAPDPAADAPLLDSAGSDDAVEADT